MEQDFFPAHHPAMAKAPAPERKQYHRTFIREWRKFRGMTLEDLAEIVGLQPSALSYLERGQSAYTQPTLEKIASALNTTPVLLILRKPTEADRLEERQRA